MNWKYLSLLTLLAFCASPEKEDAETTHLIESLDSPSYENASLPHLIKGADNKLYLSWVEKRDSNWVDLKFSALINDQWSNPELITSGNDWFVNWADYPMLAVDSNESKIAHYLAKSSAGTYSYDVNLILKPDSADKWSNPIVPHKDGTPTEHGFVTILPNNNGTFLLFWLDGRNTGSGTNEGHEGGGAMTIRSAVIDLDGNLSEEVELDDRVCDCCQTGGAMTQEGAMVVFRNRSLDEIRDMAFVTKKGQEWSESKPVAQDNWNIAGCPVNGPRIASQGNSVAVAWYTAALSRPTVKVAFKTNEDFNEPIIVDNTSPAGRVDIAMLNEQTAIVSWLDGGKESAIKYRTVNQSGSMSSVKVVANTSEARGSGFPQMEVYDGDAYFAWTELKEDKSTIRIARIRLSI